MKPSLLFRTDWTTPHTNVWKNLLAQFTGRAELGYLEVGVWEGRSLIWMFENILTHETARGTGIDSKIGDTLRLNLVAARLESRVRLIESDSEIALRTLEPNSADIVYVDGSHVGQKVMADAVLAWAALKTSGVLIFDDYGFGEDSPLPRNLKPKAALDAFLLAYSNDLEILHRDYQLIVRKREPLPVHPRNDQVSRFGDFFYSWNVYADYLKHDGYTPPGLFGVRNGEKFFLKLTDTQEQSVRRELSRESPRPESTPLYRELKAQWTKLSPNPFP